MNTLELKDLKNYLGNGLKILDKVSGNVFVLDYSKHIPTCIKEILGFKKEDFKENRTSLFEVVNDKLLLPIFHPLTDLTKPCLEGGKIPIVELAKMLTTTDGCEFDEEFAEEWILKLKKTELPYFLCEKLFFWHFWLGDQAYFEKGLIVDINSLNQEK